MSKFTEFEMTLLEASVPLATVVFDEDTCVIKWKFVAEYTSTISINAKGNGYFSVDITQPSNKKTVSINEESLASIVTLLRQLDTSILQVLVEDSEESVETEQEFLS